MLFSAIYLPARSEGTPDPSRGGFESEDAAWEFVFTNHMCRRCVESRRRAIAGTGGEFDSEYPACSAEWLVGKTADFEKAESFEDTLTAGGYSEVIYRDGDNDNARQEPADPGGS